MKESKHIGLHINLEFKETPTDEVLEKIFRKIRSDIVEEARRRGLSYEYKREVCVKMIGVIREFNEEHGYEMSPHLEAELANWLFREVFEGSDQ